MAVLLRGGMPKATGIDPGQAFRFQKLGRAASDAPLTASLGRAWIQHMTGGTPLRIDLDQHHVARTDIRASEVPDVDMMGHQNQGAIAFAFHRASDEARQRCRGSARLFRLVKKRCERWLNAEAA